ncbi:MAG: N-6 DNA methylase [Natronincolaceae bacterium]
MLDFDVKRKINTLRDILVGKVPDPKAQVEQITIALIYKFMDDMDLEGVEFGGSREFFKEDYEKYAWTNIMQPENSGQQRANLYAEGIDKMSMNPHLPQLFRDIFRGAYVPYRDPETLNMFLKEISDFKYDHSEELGNAFELLLSIMGSQGDAGQFRTPRHIIDMIVKIIDPQKTDSLLDPACGTAGFLISSFKHILEKNRDKDGHSTLSADEIRRMTENFAGYDISPDMVRLSRVNMYLHKFAKPQISEYDTLSSLEKWDESYDIILANPPFMTPKGGIIPHNRYRIRAKRAEVLFVDYIAEHLNPTGKAGVIVPEGIVFQSANAYKNLRKYLIEDDLLYAVISLPAGVFNPYSGVKTSILLMDKTLAKQKDEILFVKINNDGFDLGAQRREIKGSDIPEVIRIIGDYQKDTDVSDSPLVVTASKKDIAKQDYILVGERYKEIVVVNSDYPMLEIEELINKVKYPKKLLKSEFLDKGQFPIIDQSENYIAGFSNNSDLVFNINKPVVCFGDHTRALKYVDFNFILGADGVKILEPTDKVNTKYLYYCLSNVEIPNLGYSRHFKVLKEIKIPLPPLHIQEEIVREIEGYQKIIDGARQVVENYKPTVKIDPSWEMRKLGEICNFIDYRGKTPEKSITGIRLITAKNIRDGYISVEPQEFISKDVYEKWSTRGEILSNDVFITTEAPLGNVAINTFDETIAIAQRIISLRAKNKNLLQKYLMFILLTDYAQNEIKNRRSGTTVYGIKSSELVKIKIPIPPFTVQKQLVLELNEEGVAIEYNKKLIEIFEQKIKDRISEVWGD